MALKLIAPELASDERFRKRFLKERGAASLGHPHVLPVYAAAKRTGSSTWRCATSRARPEDASPGRASSSRSVRCSAARSQRPGRRARARPRTPRRQAREHPPRRARGRLLTDFGLTKRSAAPPRRPARSSARSTTWPRADPGRADRRADRRVRARLPALRVPDRDSAVPPGDGGGDALGAHAGRAGFAPGVPGAGSGAQPGLGEDREERFPTCAALVDSAREALGFETPRLRRRRRLMRRSRVLVAAGALVLIGAVAGLAVELTGGGSGEITEASANSLVAINPESGRIEAAIRTGRTPASVAVGEGAVWLLNVDDKTVSKIDPQTKQVIGTFGVGKTPTDLAVGENGVWVVSDGILHGRRASDRHPTGSRHGRPRRHHRALSAWACKDRPYDPPAADRGRRRRRLANGADHGRALADRPADEQSAVRPQA